MDYYTDPSMQGRGYSTTNIKMQKVNDDLSISISIGRTQEGTPTTKVLIGFAGIGVNFFFSGEEKKAIDLLVDPCTGGSLFNVSCDGIVAFCMARMPPATLYNLVGYVKRNAFDAGKDEAQQEMQKVLGLR